MNHSFAAFIDDRRISPQFPSVEQVQDWLDDSEYFLATIPVDILEVDADGKPIYF